MAAYFNLINIRTISFQSNKVSVAGEIRSHWKADGDVLFALLDWDSPVLVVAVQYTIAVFWRLLDYLHHLDGVPEDSLAGAQGLLWSRMFLWLFSSLRIYWCLLRVFLRLTHCERGQEPDDFCFQQNQRLHQAEQPSHPVCDHHDFALALQ